MGLLVPPDEFNQLALALQSAFPSDGALDDLTRMEMSTPLRDITEKETMPEMIKRVIIWFEAKGRTEELIRSAMRTVASNEILQFQGRAILERVARTQSVPWYRPPEDPYETCFVSGPKAFISRRDLRDFVRNIRATLGKPVLVINGISNTGKTFSFQLLTYLRRAFQAYNDYRYLLARIDLKNEIYSQYEPDTLAAEIAGQLGWRTESMPRRLSTRYTKELCRWLIGESNRQDAIAVVVLDGFHHPELYRETRDMVQQLIWQISENTSNIRLVMLNFPESLIPANLPGPIERESVSLLTIVELNEFFTILYKQKGRVPDPSVINRVVQLVLEKVETDAPNYNDLLNQHVTEAAKTLK
jgi:Effector-associated domain 1